MIPDNVYIINVNDLGEEEYRFAYFSMSEQRRQKCDAYRFEKDKKLCIAADMLVRRVLKEEFGISGDVPIRTTARGKPYIEGKTVEFSISHSGDYAAAAFGKNRIGIDIEMVRPIDLKLMKRFCSDEEAYYVAKGATSGKTDNADILKRFFELWTFREAYGKAAGEGLSPETFAVDFLTAEKTLFRFENYIGCVTEIGAPTE